MYELSKKDTTGPNILALYSRNVKFPDIYAKFHFPLIYQRIPDNSLTLKKNISLTFLRKV